jgi:hypothetical protein
MRGHRYTPEQLFSIVKHGIKFTGMPAWPVQQRDDEVWAMVAFLRRLPDLDAAGYRRLAYGEPDVGSGAEPPLPATGAAAPPRVVREIGTNATKMSDVGYRMGRLEN